MRGTIPRGDFIPRTSKTHSVDRFCLPLRTGAATATAFVPLPAH